MALQSFRRAGRLHCVGVGQLVPTSPPKPVEVTNTMRKNTNRAARLALGLATLAGAGALAPLGTGSASATGVTWNLPTSSSPVVGHVYLDDNTAGAVSYTHLDVYKRQILLSA